MARVHTTRLPLSESDTRAGQCVPGVVRRVLRSPGRPLDADSRRHMEPQFGHDFSNVRVHDDDRAADSARAVGALAYTVGDHVVFGRARYAPRSDAGRRLLAHELVHVAQQGGARSDPSAVRESSPANSKNERQADAFADAVIDGTARDTTKRWCTQQRPMLQKQKSQGSAGGANSAPSNLARLTELLQDDQESAAILHMATLDSGEKKLVRGSWGFRVLAADAFNDDEMYLAVEHFEGTLKDKLRWMAEEECNWFFMSEKINRTRSARERQDVYGDKDLRQYFVELRGDEDMAATVELLGGSLFNKLNWMLAEGSNTQLVLRTLRASSPAEVRQLPNVPWVVDGLRREIGEEGTAEVLRFARVAERARDTVTTPIDEEHWEKNKQTKQWSVQKFAGTGQYDIRYTTANVTITVRIRFDGTPASMSRKEDWRAAIQKRWSNHFAFKSKSRQIPVLIEPVFVASGEHHLVHLSERPSEGGRANQSNWFTDTSGDTAAHEFGHMLGLEDEYRLTLTRYIEVAAVGEPTKKNKRGGYSMTGVMSINSQEVKGRHMMPFLAWLNEAEQAHASRTGRRPEWYRLIKLK